MIFLQFDIYFTSLLEKLAMVWTAVLVHVSRAGERWRGVAEGGLGRAVLPCARHWVRAAVDRASASRAAGASRRLGAEDSRGGAELRARGEWASGAAS